MSSIGQKNSFLTYKVDRPRVLSNQDGKLFGYSKPESVFKKAVEKIEENDKSLKERTDLIEYMYGLSNVNPNPENEVTDEEKTVTSAKSWVVGRKRKSAATFSQRPSEVDIEVR